MKIKVKKLAYDKVLKLRSEKPISPKRTSFLFRTLMKAASASELKVTNFTYKTIDMDKLGRKEPCLYLMNHSSFIDLKIVSTILYPRRFNIVMTSDGFVGKRWLMRSLGCIPTNKFVTDTALVRNMTKCFNRLHTSVLLYPEASYSFDGTATPLPYGLGKCLKILGVPVVFIKTEGAFLRDPLYNNLQLRQVNVSATMEYLFSPTQISDMTVDEINAKLADCFTFDNFRTQQEQGVIVDEAFRADGLERVLYKCPHCLAEGTTVGSGTAVVCKSCGASYELTELGYLNALNVPGKFTHVPDWYAWQRQCVRKELENGTYSLDVPVKVIIMKGTKAVYDIGNGRLTHGLDGFRLVAAGGKLDYRQSAKASYGLYADYNWYELGDIICIGDNDYLYYCFPQGADGVVAKTRLATEELYKMLK